MAKKTNQKKPSGNVRSARSGQFVGAGKAKSSPNSTVTEKRVATQKVACPDCDGKGLNPLDATKLCDNCNGKGKVQA